MNKPFLRKIVFLCALACVQIQAHASATVQAYTQAPATFASTSTFNFNSPVKASEYCAFLNHVALSGVIPAEAGIQDNVELNPVYDEHMATDPYVACIVRLGTPGKYFYQVIAGRENFPVMYVSSCNEKNYSDWLQERLQAAGYRLQEDDAEDDSLKCNITSFAVDASSSPTLVLAVAAPTSTSNFTSYIEEASGIVALVACSALMSGRGAPADEMTEADGTREQQEQPVPLQKFREAAIHPDNIGKERVIVIGSGEDSTIVAREADPNTSGRNRSENIATRKTLKRSLEAEGHSATFVTRMMAEVHPHPSWGEKLTVGEFPLSHEKLTLSLARADAAMAEKIASEQASVTRTASAIVQKQTKKRNVWSIARSGLRNFLKKKAGSSDLAKQVIDAALPKTSDEILDDAQRAVYERDQIKIFIQQLIQRDRLSETLQAHYKNEDEAWREAEKGWDQRPIARWDAEQKKEELTRAREFLEQVKAKLAENDLKESQLEKVAQGGDMASAIFGIVNLPFVSLQGISQAISTFARLADNKMTMSEARTAATDLEIAIQQAEQATQAAQKIEAAVSDHAARAEQAEADASWIDNLAASAWRKRMMTSEEEMKNLTDESSSAAENVRALRSEYNTAEEGARSATAEAMDTKRRLQAALEAKAAQEAAYEKTREELNLLEEQLKTSHDKDATQRELDNKRREHRLAKTEADKASEGYTQIEQETKIFNAAATVAHAEAFEKFKKYDAAKKIVLRNRERAVGRAKTDAEVCKATWPEIYYQELVRSFEDNANKVSELAEQAWEEAMTISSERPSEWLLTLEEYEQEVKTIYDRVSRLAQHAEIAWNEVITCSNEVLTKISETHRVVRENMIIVQKNGEKAKTLWSNRSSLETVAEELPRRVTKRSTTYFTYGSTYVGKPDDLENKKITSLIIKKWIANKKSTIALAAGNREEANLWERAAWQWKETVTCLHSVRSPERDRAASGAEYAARNFEHAAKQRAKALEAQTSGQDQIAELWNKAANEFVAVAVAWQDAETSFMYDKRARTLHDLGHFARQAADNIQRYVEQRAKAVKAQMLGQNEITELLNKAANASGASAEYWQRAIMVLVAGNHKKAEFFGGVDYGLLSRGAAHRLEDVAKNFEASAEQRAKAIKAEALGELEVATLWNKASEYRRYSAEVLLENGEVWWCFAPEVTCAESAAYLFEKTAEALAKGDREKADNIKKDAQQKAQEVEEARDSRRAAEERAKPWWKRKWFSKKK